jgi:methylated-DNA-[protein]-cysteine S-methyltransferase
MANADPADVNWARHRGADALIGEARRQLDAYFARRLEIFDLPLAPNGTGFQRQVWSALVKIPFGTTTTYGALARQLGNAAAMRAVGAANGRNPIPIIVPCHRVIGSDGSLTGFGGGLERKQWLLRHEGAQALLDI